MAKNSLLIGVVVVVVIVALAAVALMNGVHTTTTYGQKTGAMLYSVSDAPLSGTAYSAVNLTVQNITVHSQTTGQWYTVPVTGSGTYDLLTLKSSYAFVGNATLPAGNYNEIAVAVKSVTATSANGTVNNVVLPSSVLKVFGNFTVAATNGTKAVNWANIDFMANQSLHTTGNGKIVMLPVVQILVWHNSSLAVQSSGHLTVNNPSPVVASIGAGMNVNGTMQAGLVVPQGTNLTVGASGNVGLGVG